MIFLQFNKNYLLCFSFFSNYKQYIVTRINPFFLPQLFAVHVTSSDQFFSQQYIFYLTTSYRFHRDVPFSQRETFTVSNLLRKRSALVTASDMICHRKLSIFSPSCHREFTVSSPRVLRKFTAKFTASWPRVHREFTTKFTASSPRVHRGFTASSPAVHRQFTASSPRVHRFFPAS